MNKKEFNYTTVISHLSDSHPSDIFCFAMCLILNKDEINIIKTTDSKLESVIEEFGEDNCILIGIGEGEYNDHKKNAKLRYDGEKSSSFELLWMDYGHLLIEDDYIRDKFDKEFVAMIDHLDNNVSEDTEETSKESIEVSINLAVFTLRIRLSLFSKLVIPHNKLLNTRNKITESESSILLLNEYCKECEDFIRHDHLKYWFIIYPSLDGEYFIAISNSHYLFSDDFIKEGVPLDGIIPDLISCYIDRSKIVCASKESCIIACQYSISQYNPD